MPCIGALKEVDLSATYPQFNNKNQTSPRSIDPFAGTRADECNIGLRRYSRKRRP